MPFFGVTNALTNTATPAPAAGDPPTNMTILQTKKTLLPQIWAQTTGDNNDSTGFNNGTLTSITSLSSAGGYANGSNYATGNLFFAAPASAAIRNFGFEDLAGPTLNGTGTASGNFWTIEAQSGNGPNGSAANINEATAGQTLSQGITPQTGSRMAFVRIDGPGAIGSTDPRIGIELLDSSGNRIAYATNTTIFNAWTVISIPAQTTYINQLMKIRLSVVHSINLSDFLSPGTSTPYVRFTTDLFVYSGGNMNVFANRNTNSSGQNIGFDDVAGVRADYSGTHELISQVIRMPPSLFTGAQESATKIWYRMEIDLDIPTTPTGHGARVDAYIKTGPTLGTSYALMPDGPTQVLTNYTAVGLNQNGATGATGIALTGALLLTSRPYLRWRIVLNSGVAAPTATSDTGTVTPVIKEVRIKFFNDFNYYWSQQVDLGTSANGWAPFLTSETDNGATVSFWVRAASTLSALSTAVWTATTVGSNPGPAFARFAQWAVRISPAAGTTTLPEIEAESLGWSNGLELTHAPVASGWHQRRYWCSVQEQTFGYNNRVWVLDSRMAWTSFSNINALSMCNLKDKILTGRDNMADGRVNLQWTTLADDGTAITSSVRLKDYPMGDLRRPLTIRGVEVMGRAIQFVPPGIGSGLIGGTGYVQAPISLVVAPVVGAESISSSLVTLPSQGEPSVYMPAPANFWGPTVSAVITGGEVNRRWGVDAVTLNVWIKEPQGR